MTSKTGESRYGQRGVSSGKEEVHAAVASLDKGLFPGAFCRIIPDILTGDETQCLVPHSDGAGSKLLVAYLYWRETGDLSGFRNVSQCSLVMNTDDLACVGAPGPLVVTQTIDRNKARFPGEVIEAIIGGCQEFCQQMTDLGIPMYYAGGETADLGDQVRTGTVNNTIMARMSRADVIDAGRIRPGAYIVGFSSTGQAAWESTPNSGIGCNGLTSARHDLLSASYKDWSETFAPETDEGYVYCGPYRLQDTPVGINITVAQALLSPTRTYVPLIRDLLAAIDRTKILGLIHCSGGGQTKIGKFGPEYVAYVKGNLFPTPPLFQVLQSASGTSWQEMYETYNMGHRLEGVFADGPSMEEALRVAKACNIEAKVVGWVETRSNLTGRVTIRTDCEEFVYG